MDRLDIQVLLEKLDQLPSLPSVAMELLEKVQEERVGASEIARLIEKDQGLTLQLLKLSNSAFYHRAQEVQTVKDAVVAVGLDAVKMLVLSVSVLKIFAGGKEEESPTFEPRRFWLHSLACATGARIICAKKHPALAEIAFVAGLLHDVGKAVLNELVPESYAKVVALGRSRQLSALEAERKSLGVDHVVVGKLLAEKWNLPASLRDVVWLHHQPAVYTGPEDIRFVLAGVHVADWICNHYGLSADPEAGFLAADREEMERLGLPVEDVYRKLREELQESLSLFDVVKPSADLLLEVLQRSNQQLGRMSRKVHQAWAALKRRNSVVEALAAMGESLQPIIHLTDVAQTVAAGTLRGVDADAVALQVFVGGGRFLQAIARRCDQEEVKTEINITQKESNKGFVVAEGWIEGDRVQLVAGGRVVGYMTAWYDPLRCSPHRNTTADMTLFAQMGAPALERARLRALVDEKLERMPAAPPRTGPPAEGGPSEPAGGTERDYQLFKEVLAVIGHEFNNLLTGVLGQAELLQLKERDPEKKKRLQSIENAATDAADLIARYRKKFGRTLSGNRQNVLDLEQLAREVLELQGQQGAGRSGGREIPLEVQPGGPWLALGNVSEIKEVLINLLLNAQDATAGKGEVSVSVGGQGKHAFVRVKDTGHGIPPQTLGRIFDPFFTTKKGQGTGIGLTISRTILKNHGGDLKVSSRPGEGSVFEALLPRWRGEISKNNSLEDHASFRRKVKALLMEDNDQTRETVRDMLHSIGVDADCVGDAAEVEERLQREVYDLVLIDLKESTVLEMIQAIKNRGVPAPVLLVTGKRDEAEEELPERLGLEGVLLKPFTMRQLSSAVNKVLEGSASDPRGPRPGGLFRATPKGSAGE